MPVNTTPQSVSSRYAHNLLIRGANRTFELDNVSQEVATTKGGLPCGFYYTAMVKRHVGFDPSVGEGMTPVEALTKALAAAGVTFR